MWHHRLHDLRHHLLPFLFNPQLLFRPTKTTPWICQFLKGQESFLPLKKENTVLTITFVFIAVNQDTELWTKKLRPNELIRYTSSYCYVINENLVCYWSPFCSTATKKNLNFAFNRLQKPLRFFIFVLTLAPTNSIKISNKHFVPDVQLNSMNYLMTPSLCLIPVLLVKFLWIKNMRNNKEFHPSLWYELSNCRALTEILLAQGPWPISYIYFSFPLTTNRNSHAFFWPTFFNFL